MSEEYFYHYTNQKSAKAIFLSGKILPSLRSNGDAVHGDGVYLTTLDPKLGKDIVIQNNWDGVTRNSEEKMECYFEILMPSSKVTRAKEKRDIQIFTGELALSQYKWSLKDWSGDLMATQHFMVRSEGAAAVNQSTTMGRYTLCGNIVMQKDKPVYKHDTTDMFLYSINGNWHVSAVAGNNADCLLFQPSNTPSPHKTIPWKYALDYEWQEDETLKVRPCY